jgi:hypothetical protein
MEYEIDYSKLQVLQAALAKAPEVVREELGAAVTEADLLLQREVQDAMPVAGGTLRQSVFHEEEIQDTAVMGLVATPLNYGPAVELGTKPHFPPVEALIDWVRTKLHVTDERTAKGIAFAIARKISRVGTPEQRPFGRVYQAQLPQVNAIFDRAGARIAARLAGA